MPEALNEAPFDMKEQLLYSKLPLNVRAPRPMPKGGNEETYFGRLFPVSFFQSLPRPYDHS